MSIHSPAALLAAAEILDLLAPGATSATKSLLAVRLVDLVTEIVKESDAIASRKAGKHMTRKSIVRAVE